MAEIGVNASPIRENPLTTTEKLRRFWQKRNDDPKRWQDYMKSKEIYIDDLKKGKRKNINATATILKLSHTHHWLPHQLPHQLLQMNPESNECGVKPIR